VVGEAFQRRGRTDILLVLSPGAVFAAELKVWHGESKYVAGLEQLFNYLPLRHGHTALVNLCADDAVHRGMRDRDQGDRAPRVSEVSLSGDKPRPFRQRASLSARPTARDHSRAHDFLARQPRTTADPGGFANPRIRPRHQDSFARSHPPRREEVTHPSATVSRIRETPLGWQRARRS
jgi:hypothetical protein